MVKKRTGKHLVMAALGCLFFLPVLLQAQEHETWLQGVAALENKDYHAAAMCFATAQVSQENELKVMLLHGQSLMLDGNYEEALKLFYLADQRSPGISALWIAKTYILAGDPEKALSWLKVHLDSPWRRPRKEIILDTLLSRLEGSAGWRELWKRDWYTEKEKGIAEAAFLSDREEYREALSLIERLTLRYGEDAQLRSEQARVKMATGDLNGAIEDYRKALQLEPEDTAALSGLAEAETRNGNPEEAVKAYTGLLKLAPERLEVYLQRAGVYAQQGAYDEAMNDLKQYLIFFPNNTATLFRLGLYASTAGKTMDAMRYLSKVIDQDASRPDYFIARAQVYLKTHTYRYAIQDYGMALDLDPTNGDVYLNRGEALIKTGKKKEACFDFKQAYHYGKKEAITWLQKYCGL